MPAEQDRVPAGIYWNPQLWDDARAAFVSGLKHDPNPPAAFIAWLHRALKEHVTRAPGEGPRGKARGVQTADVVGPTLPAPAGGGRLGILRPEPRSPGQGRQEQDDFAGPGTLEHMDHAVARDVEELDRLGGRSAFVHKAVTLAAAGTADGTERCRRRRSA